MRASHIQSIDEKDHVPFSIPASNNCTGRIDKFKYISNFWIPSFVYPQVKTLGDRGNDVHMQESLMKEGKIFVDRDWSLVMLCQLDFTNYPFDSHVCPFQIISQYDGVETIQTKSTFRAGNNEGIGACSKYDAVIFVL